MITLTLNLECGVKSLVDQVVLCSIGGHLECRIVLIKITSKNACQLQCFLQVASSESAVSPQ